MAQNKVQPDQILLDTDGTFAANSDQAIPSQKAVKTYADSLSTDKNYYQSFTTTAMVVVIHNLGKKPSVTVINSAGDEVEGDIHYDSDDQVTVVFSASFSGIITCN